MINQLRSTLTKYPGSMLEAMFSGRHSPGILPILSNSQGMIQVLTYPEIFKLILEFLRIDNFPFFQSPNERVAFFRELDYFGLPKNILLFPLLFLSLKFILNYLIFMLFDLGRYSLDLLTHYGQQWSLLLPRHVLWHGTLAQSFRIRVVRDLPLSLPISFLLFSKLLTSLPPLFSFPR